MHLRTILKKSSPFIAGLCFISCTTPSHQKIDIAASSFSTDFHMHIHSPPEEADDMEFNAERALFAADSAGIRRALVLSNSYSARATKEYAVRENSFVLKQAAKNRQRLSGACAVNPLQKWSSGEIDRCAASGLKVLKLHFMASGMDLRKINDFNFASLAIAAAEKNHMIVSIHANYPSDRRPGEIEKLIDLINKFQNTRWIIGHSFGREFKLLNKIINPHAFVEMSVLPTWLKTPEERKTYVDTMREVGIKRFLFGSDWPVIHPAETLKALRALPLTDNEFDLILNKNAAQLNDLFEP